MTKNRVCSSSRMASCTVRSERLVRAQMFATLGQQSPESFALSARESATSFRLGGMSSFHTAVISSMLNAAPAADTA
jgi:hypothetical protein